MADHGGGSQHGRNAAATPIRPELDSAIEQLLPAKKLTKAPAATTAVRRRPVVAKRDWAHVVDVNREIANFHELVPDMAREVSFPSTAGLSPVQFTVLLTSCS